MNRLELDDVTKSYEGVKALDATSLEVLAGEKLVVLGPSGAGKTVLARLISGLESLDSGDVRLDDRSLLLMLPHERKVGYIPSGNSLWPHRTVAENVGYSLKLKGVGRRERRAEVAEMLASARIESLGDRNPESLSPLQRRKVEIARALIASPDVLIFDQPMAGLDPRSQIELREDIRRIHFESVSATIIMTSDPAEALALADRVAVIDFGKIVQVGTPSDVYNRPLDSFVARMMGPANLLQGQAEGLDGRGDIVVRTPLGRLIGRGMNGELLTQGSPVTLMIRPEALGLGATVPADANRFLATVEGQTMLGATRQISLRGPGEWPILALALQATSEKLREGQSVTVSVAPDFVLVLPSKISPNGSEL